MLAHAVPVVELTRPALPSVDDHELVRRINDRNARVGETYLAAVAARVADGSVSVRTAIAERESIDLVIASSHGATSSLDRPCGSVAAHLLERSPLPLLLVRDLPSAVLEAPRGAGSSADTRRHAPQTPRLPGLELVEEA